MLDSQGPLSAISICIAGSERRRGVGSCRENGIRLRRDLLDAPRSSAGPSRSCRSSTSVILLSRRTCIDRLHPYYVVMLGRLLQLADAAGAARDGAPDHLADRAPFGGDRAVPCGPLPPPRTETSPVSTMTSTDLGLAGEVDYLPLLAKRHTSNTPPLDCEPAGPPSMATGLGDSCGGQCA